MNRSGVRLTIAIPLHGGARWIGGIIDTVSKTPAWSRVVLSDASHLDDTTSVLSELYADEDRIEVISHSGTLTWVEHANLLLERADTELFCWMPQDDLVFPEGYFELLVSALDKNPGRVLAFPSIYRKATRGRLRRRYVGEVAYPPPPVELGTAIPSREAVELLCRQNFRHWDLGLGCWRGVFRREVARPLPETDDCPDVTWGFSMALAGNLIEVPQARYLKRFHRGSAQHSMRWQGRREARAIYRKEVEARLGPDQARAEEVLVEVDRYLYWHRLLGLPNPVRRLAVFLLDWPRAVFE